MPRTNADWNRNSALVPPDWVFFIVWPLLKLSAAVFDWRSAALLQGRPAQRGLLIARLTDWVLFLLFPRLAPRSGRATTVSALTLGQAVATADAMRRVRTDDPSLPRLLAPQLVWLLYASAVPLAMSASARTRD